MISLAQYERIGILVEEMGEALQILGKIQRHGFDSYHPNDPSTTNRDLLEMELGHVLYAIGMMTDRFDLNFPNILDHEQEKRNRVNNYLHHQSDIAAF